jgi:hypothetical protein
MLCLQERSGLMLVLIIHLLATLLILISLILIIKNQFTKPNHNAMLPSVLLLIASLILLFYNILK